MSMRLNIGQFYIAGKRNLLQYVSMVWDVCLRQKRPKRWFMDSYNMNKSRSPKEMETEEVNNKM